MKSHSRQPRCLAFGLSNGRSCAVLLCFALQIPAAAFAADKLIFGWSAITGSQAVPWITKEAGLFEKHGLDTIGTEVADRDQIRAQKFLSRLRARSGSQ